MAVLVTAAAIDRPIHHSIVLEFGGKSGRRFRFAPKRRERRRSGFSAELIGP
jgi:hypothetical protein